MPRSNVRRAIGLGDGVVNLVGGNWFNIAGFLYDTAYDLLSEDPSFEHVKTIYIRALERAWKESYADNDVPDLNANDFKKYLDEVLTRVPSSSLVYLRELDTLVVEILREKRNLPKETQLSTGRFLERTRHYFESFLLQDPELLGMLLFNNVQDLLTFVEQNRQTVRHIQRQQQDVFDSLHQRVDLAQLQHVVGEKVATLFDERLNDIVTAVTLLERVRQEDHTIAELSMDNTETLRLSVTNDGNITYGGNGQAIRLQDFSRLLSRLAAPPLLQLTTPVYHTHLKPSEVLSSAREIVPFYGRDDDLDDLYAWCQQEQCDPIDVRLYTGEGGVGKTRLMRQLCRRVLRDGDGWHAGFLQIDPRQRQDFTVLCEPERPTLVVIDDAMLYTNEIAEFINEIDQYINQRSAERTRIAPFRIVLLARTAGDWWDTVKRKVKREPVEPTVVAPLRTESRAEMFEQAVAAFADARKYGAAPERETPSALLDREPFGRILLIHMLALLTVERTADQTDTSETRILDDILTLEERHWAPLCTENNSSNRLFSEDHARYIVRHLLCLATLGYRIKNQGHFIQLCNELGELELQKLSKAERRRLAAVLGDIYRDDSVMLVPLKPDLLGEHLIERTLFDAKEEEITDEGEAILALAFDSEDAPDSNRGKNTKRGLEVLFQLAQRRTNEGVVILKAVLERRIEALASNPEYVDLTPVGTVALNEIAARFTQIAYEKAELGSLTRARLAGNLGVRQSAVGEYEKAYTATRKAIDQYSKFTKEHPSEFDPVFLAMLQNNLCGNLNALKRKEEALSEIKKAIGLLGPYLMHSPNALASPMAMLVRNYFKQCEEMAHELDIALLLPIAIAFQETHEDNIVNAFLHEISNLVRRALEDDGLSEEELANIFMTKSA